MFSAKFFALMFAVLLVQSSTTKVENQKDLKSLQEEAEQLLEQLKELVEKEIAAAKAKIQEIINKIQTLAQQVIADAEQKIKEEIDKLNQAIEDLKNQFGDKVEACLEVHLQEIEDLPNRVLNEVISCVTDQVNEALGIVNQVIADIESIPQIVVKLEEDLKNCNNILCYPKVIAECTKAIADIPKDIAEQVAKATALVEGLEVRLLACLTEKVEALGLECADILADIAKCAISKH